MYRLAEGDGCRHERVVGHFGEVVAPCGDACDRCTGEDVVASAPAVRVSRASSRGGRGGAGRRAESGGRDAALDAEMDLELFEALRAWRGEIARARGVPAYVVFADATLAELALRRPVTRDELLEVKGIGPRKLEEYGESIVKLLRQGK